MRSPRDHLICCVVGRERFSSLTGVVRIRILASKSLTSHGGLSTALVWLGTFNLGAGSAAFALLGRPQSPEQAVEDVVGASRRGRLESY